MTFITAARFPRMDYHTNHSVRQRADQVQHHLEEIALDVGLAPERNVKRMETHSEIRIGISEYMDEYYREAPGSWRHY